MQGAQVRSLAGELRSHVLPVRPRKLKTKNKQRERLLFSQTRSRHTSRVCYSWNPVRHPSSRPHVGDRYILHSHAVATSEGVTENCHLSVTGRDVEKSCPKIPTTSPAWESPLPITWHRPPMLQSTTRNFSLTKFGLTFIFNAIRHF